jgi:hypothetical protein
MKVETKTITEIDGEQVKLYDKKGDVALYYAIEKQKIYITSGTTVMWEIDNTKGRFEISTIKV